MGCNDGGNVDMYVKLSLVKVEFHLFHLIVDVHAQGGREKLILVAHFTLFFILFD